MREGAKRLTEFHVFRTLLLLFLLFVCLLFNEKCKFVYISMGILRKTSYFCMPETRQTSKIMETLVWDLTLKLPAIVDNLYFVLGIWDSVYHLHFC